MATSKAKAVDKHPYMSGTAGLMQVVAQFRKTFPGQVNADTLKKLSIAPNNESYVLNILRFLGVLDAEGNKTTNASAVFNQHEDADFQEAFAKLVEVAYGALFDLHGEASWSLPVSKLIGFFRNTDHTSAIVGQRQASTFQALAILSGKLDGGSAKAVVTKAAQLKVTKKSTTPQAKKPSTSMKAAPVDSASIHSPPTHSPQAGGADVGLTVRIEINLPANGDQETYDRIFKSIRENLLNAKVA